MISRLPGNCLDCPFYQMQIAARSQLPNRVVGRSGASQSARLLSGTQNGGIAQKSHVCEHQTYSSHYINGSQPFLDSLHHTMPCKHWHREGKLDVLYILFVGKADTRNPTSLEAYKLVLEVANLETISNTLRSLVAHKGPADFFAQS